MVPRRLSGVWLLWTLAVAGLCKAQVATLSLEHRVLLLTTTAYQKWATSFLEDVMDGYGTPLTVLAADGAGAAALPADLKPLLWERPGGGGAGRFSGFVMHPDAEAGGLLSAAQLSDLQDYQRRTGARVLKFDAAPEAFGMAAAPCGSDDVTLRFTPATPFGVSGVRPGAALPARGLRRCPGSEAAAPNNLCCARPAAPAPRRCAPCRPAVVLRAGAPPGGAANAAAAAALSGSGAAGAVAAYADGRQAMAFALRCSSESAACLVLAHLGLAWVMQGLIPGARKAVFSLQVDDVFLATSTASGSYRSTPADLEAHLAWQEALSSKLPNGSRIRAEMVFNGNGVLSQMEAPDAVVHEDACFETALYKELGCSCWGKAMSECPATAHWFCRSCTKDWKRVRGSPGVTHSPPPDTSRWGDKRFSEGDPLYRFVKGSRRAAEGFFWSSHTFSHQMLDNTTFEATKLELDLNTKMAGPEYLDISGRATFSPAGLVTPAISGLFNGDALAAMAAAGVTFVTGDNTWRVFENPWSRRRVTWTNEAANGFPYQSGQYAIAILPRWATAVAYSASTTADALAAYNAGLSPGDGGPATTFEALMGREADRVLREALMVLRHDGHMFHQANMRVAGSGGAGSLLMMWAEYALARLIALVDWPVTSLKLDDQAALFLQREARDACRLSYLLGIDPASGTVVSVTASAAGAPAGGGECAAPLILRDGVSLDLGGGRQAPVSTSDGVRAAVLRVPPGGSARAAVAGQLPWLVPAVARR
ncbi:MAG: hypothetical protein J3K34DRAFT_520782 [Monoraphidium minutum]|nr:MAG: hypothetical protein J3K34DRAFT_520782 [Monoraphidium minutum]